MNFVVFFFVEGFEVVWSVDVEVGMEFDVFDGLVVNVVVKLVVFINVGVDIDGIFWNGDVCIY